MTILFSVKIEDQQRQKSNIQRSEYFIRFARFLLLASFHVGTIDCIEYYLVFFPLSVRTVLFEQTEQEKKTENDSNFLINKTTRQIENVCLVVIGKKKATERDTRENRIVFYLYPHEIRIISRFLFYFFCLLFQGLSVVVC